MLNFLKNVSGKILKLFFLDPDKEYYLRKIAAHLGQEPGVFQYNLDKLVKEGILADERKGNLRYFRLNKNYPLYEEIKKIVSKTLGIEAKLKELVSSFNGIECAFIFGSIAKNTENSSSDIDLMLIGNADQDVLTNKITEAENELGREINYHLFGKDEITGKVKNKNDFLLNIFNNPIIKLKGACDGYTKFNQSGEA